MSVVEAGEAEEVGITNLDGEIRSMVILYTRLLRPLKAGLLVRLVHSGKT